ncbi:DUF2157 domain-containing protein [Neolewinella antarctica]|uniref:DUF4401 domain-containing protein n=1 Tax=Neolewinella antarctica TaxID=442734 RepID=A0ABX0X6J5_9BACT|nr:DUF4401 domain-containing protein [Neolewinella antarctica]NJC24849.1 hypothetical protein [Neolewinella antarctica]
MLTEPNQGFTEFSVRSRAALVTDGRFATNHPTIMVTTRQYLLFLARRGAIRAPVYGRALRENVYATLPQWQTFVRITLLTLGLGLVTSALVYLLAFNWDVLTTVTKLSLAGAGVVVPTLMALFPVFSPFIRKMLMTAAAMMVGALFAVYGQIYQTGADNYEYFLAWFVFTTVWAVVVDFPALWILWLIVGNLTLYFFGEQVLEHWRTYETLGASVVTSGLALLTFTVLSNRGEQNYPAWFLNTIALGLGVVAVAAIALTAWSDEMSSLFYVVRFGVLGVLFGGLAIGYFRRWLGLLSVMSLAVIASLAVLITLSNDDAGFYFAGLWVLGATTFAAITINTLRNEWSPSTAVTGAAAGAGDWERSEATAEAHGEGGFEKSPWQVTNLADLAGTPQLENEYQAALENEYPLGLQLLSLFGGLMAMVTLVAFLFLIGVMDEIVARLVVGVLLVSGALLVDKSVDKPFLGALEVASVTAGTLLVLYASAEYFATEAAITLVALLLCAGILLLFRNGLVQLLAVLGVHLSIVSYLMLTEDITWVIVYVAVTGYLIAAWVLLESHLVTGSRYLAARYSAIRTGSIVSFLAATITCGYFYQWAKPQEIAELGWFTPVLYTLLIPIILYVAYYTIRTLKEDSVPAWSYVAGLALLLSPLYFAPAAAPGLLIIILSFRVNHRLGLTLGCLCFIYFMGQYYYDLNLTLLAKSAVLAASGVFFLLTYLAIHRKLTVHEAAH